MRGFIRKRKTKSGVSWQICVSLGYDPVTRTYRKHWETVNGTKKDAERRLVELITLVENGGVINKNKVTVAERLGGGQKSLGWETSGCTV